MIRIIIKFLAGMFIMLLLIVAGSYVWYTNRPLPATITDQPLFEGINYTRVIQREPLPLIYHVLRVDLTTPGLQLLVTPADQRSDDYSYSARTTSDFLREFDVQLAINGDFFDPWYANTLWDYYPQPGDGVNVAGLTISSETVVTPGYSQNVGTLYITPDQQPSFERPSGAIAQALSGYPMLMQRGQRIISQEDFYLMERHPRTAVALDETGKTLLLVIVDGRQPNYSEGATLAELIAIIEHYGGYDALNLDGGGSTTLVIEGENGSPVQLNSAIHTRIPGRERPIANHLGIFAPPLAPDW